MNNFPAMPVLTQEQQKIIADTCNVMVNRADSSEHSQNLRVVAQIALAALTAERRAEAAEMALNVVRAQRDLEMERNDKAEEKKAELHAEIYRLKEELKGPDGFSTWKDAAISLKLAVKNTDRGIDYLTAMSAFHSNAWHKMDPITGYMNGWNACVAEVKRLNTQPAPTEASNEQ